MVNVPNYDKCETDKQILLTHKIELIASNQRVLAGKASQHESRLLLRLDVLFK